MRQWWLPVVVLCLILSFGCCAYLLADSSDSGSNTTTDPVGPRDLPTNASGNHTLVPANPSASDWTHPPVAHIFINVTEGPAPYYPDYRYQCNSGPNVKLTCEFRLDNRTFAKDYGLKPAPFANSTRPDFYRPTLAQPGRHTLELIAVDENGLRSSYSINFTVLPPPDIEKPGWYGCNNNSAYPCSIFQQAYCDKFTPTNLAVRQAASAAIARHEGEYSVNQLLDIYDWVHTHVPYQNVPVNLSYQPYSPEQTLATKSGDCKNQAILIASMVEAIGGTSRVLIIPGCSHAFSEVYLGNKSNLNAFEQAVFSHYSSKMTVNWHTSGNDTWFIMDTAGGQYPGQTLPDCLNGEVAEQTFVLLDCNRPPILHPPASGNVEYGPFYSQNLPEVLDPNYYKYPTYKNPDAQPSYRFCRYTLDYQSLSGMPFSFYVLPEDQLNNFNNYYGGSRSGSYTDYNRQENVLHAHYQMDWTGPGGFIPLIYNRGSSSMTVQQNDSWTCYK